MTSSFPESAPVHAARLWSSAGEGRVVCSLCAHRCTIPPGEPGTCGVRENRNGKLITLSYGKVVAASPDPIEKKPFYHVFPGTASFSIAAAGCNFRCRFCQNWSISQTRGGDGPHREDRRIPPENVVRFARAAGCRSISYTYTEPTIFFEYALDTAVLARAAGMFNAFVTNGFMTAEALKVIRPYLDAANVDLKAFKDETYREVCGGRLQPVLDSIVLMRKLGIWVEATTLIVPGLNDDEAEIGEIAGFLAGIDRNIPWHISRFHPDFEFTSAPATPLGTLNRAAEIGRGKGLRFVYTGNISGESEPTVCSSCRQTLIRRRGFTVIENRLIDGRCPRCNEALPGLFTVPAAGPIPL
jgi:pyruvate formate lyase activating enzyme